MQTMSAVRALTFEELYRQIEQLPEGITGEIVEPGVLSTMPRPGLLHERALVHCHHDLRPFDAELRGTGWWILREFEIRFPGGRLLVPDLAGWRVDRVAKLPNENPLTILPDWCCEVLSPSTAKKDRTKKLPVYAKAGVPWVWIVDPAARTIEVFHTREERPSLFATADETESPPLPPFEAAIDTRAWWTDAT